MNLEFRILFFLKFEKGKKVNEIYLNNCLNLFIGIKIVCMMFFDSEILYIVR